jgi:hypothetical protein
MAASGARAQQPAMPVVGFLDPRSPDALADRLRGFRRGLKDAGYVEGETLRSNIAGPRIRMNGCRSWRPTWLVDGLL